MDKYEVIKNNLFGKIENHTMTILNDDGLYRHISFSNNGSNFYKFDIITWPGYLSICGDIGNYSFSRSVDMFKFFRNEKPSFGYWAEKCVSEDTSNKIKEFSVEYFNENVLNYVVSELEGSSRLDKFWEDKPENFKWDKDNIPKEIMNELKYLLNCNDQYECIQEMRNFSSDLIKFDDFWEYNVYEYSNNFIVCCYAIVWAIQKYDLVKG